MYLTKSESNQRPRFVRTRRDAPQPKRTYGAARLNGYALGRGRLPVRLQFIGLACNPCIAGSHGAHGDAGWGLMDILGLDHLRQITRAYPQARMPCWTDLGL